LIHVLTRYQDAAGTPITVFFDGSGPKRGPREAQSGDIEVLYSRAGQTAGAAV